MDVVRIALPAAGYNTPCMSTKNTKRIAMWSGPRNISTALLRSWGNRVDTYVCDEPLYAHYLQATGIEHPGAGEVMARHPTDWRQVTDWLVGPVPEGRKIFYQKHMAHHLLPNIERRWLDQLQHCFLIRDPAEMLTSLTKHLPEPTLEDTGLPQQRELFQRMLEQDDAEPPVIDARDVLENPEGMLRSLCRRLDVDFLPSMLHWPPGGRETDGVWAKHWYEAVNRSTSFHAYRPKDEKVPAALQDLHQQCLEHYETLSRHRLRPE
jgi:hypothetical protein